MASIETQQGKLRPRQPRPGDGNAVLTAPNRDPESGRFMPDNDFSRLRRLKTAYQVGFVGLNPDEVVPHLRPFVAMANVDASRLAEEAGAEASPSLTGLAEQAANALAFARGLLALAAGGDPKAQEQARHWMREYRQFVIALRAEARTPLRQPVDDFAAVVAAAEAEADADAHRDAERRPRVEVPASNVESTATEPVSDDVVQEIR